jgi:hypothetical protein
LPALQTYGLLIRAVKTSYTAGTLYAMLPKIVGNYKIDLTKLPNNYIVNSMADFIKIKRLLCLNSQNGFNDSEIHKMLDSIGTLPKILFDFYKKYGKYDFNNWQDRLTTPKYWQDDIKKPEYITDVLNYYTTDEYLLICIENQGCCFAGIKKDDLYRENPPVYFSFDTKNWEIGCDNLFDYIHGFVYYNVVCYLGFNGYFDLSDEGYHFIRTNFKSKNIKLINWPANSCCEFYGDYDDTIMMIVGGGCFFYASKNEKHFIEMENKWKGLDIEYK